MARREVADGTAGSADIAFLLLTFFLLTTTMEQNKGMSRRLPPMNDATETKIDPENKINKRNILQVHVNKSDNLLVNGVKMDPSALKEKVRMFILNPNNDESMSEKEQKTIENLATPAMVSKAVVSLQTDRGTSYNVYMEVQNEVMKAYNELRNEYASATFSKSFADLSEEEQKVVQAVYPLNLSEAEPRGKAAIKTN